MKESIKIFRADLSDLLNILVSINLFSHLNIYAKNNKGKFGLHSSEDDLIFQHLDEFESQRVLNNFLYINVITILETYLFNRLKEELINKEDVAKKLVENYNLDRKLSPKDVINGPKILANEILDDLIYHNFKKVDVLYKIVFNISIVGFIPSELWKSVKIRHKLVHQSGIVNNQRVQIRDTHLIDLIDYTSNWIENIEFKIKHGRLRKSFPSFFSKYAKALKRVEKSKIVEQTSQEILDNVMIKLFSQFNVENNNF